jgi:hypothetical protein
MLFSDSDIVTAADMLQIDSEVASVAQSCNPSITLEGTGSICEQTWRQCGGRIQAAQQMYTSTLAAIGVSGGHQAAVNYIGLQARNQSRTRLNQVVASESQYGAAASGVQMWMAYTALSLFYRDASARLGKDRLQEKYTRYLTDADFQWRQLRQIGLPYVSQPLEAPGAKHGVAPGTWGAANVTMVPGAGTAQIWQIAITYYDASRYVSEANTQNAESAPSAILLITVSAASVMQVSIASLNPPTGVMDQVGLSQGPWMPLTATHWTIWAGAPAGPLYRQAALPIATKTYTFAGDPVLSGAVLTAGQWPDLNLTFTSVIGRG